MKKIYILTFTDSINYGALLQAFSLQTFLKSLGNNVALIDYQNKKRMFSQVNGIKKVRSIIWHYCFEWMFSNKNRIKNADIFKKEYLNLTPKTYRNNEQLKELNSSGDIFIVGSDQVWNPSNNANDSAYFLSFVENHKKISYAASFGTINIPDSYYYEIQKDLLEFSDISVREESARFALKKYLNIETITVLDPVFLLNSDEWITHLNIKKNHDRYVLVYLLPGNNDVQNEIFFKAKSIAEELNVRIISLGKRSNSVDCLDELIDCECSPHKFVEYFYNAEYVVTNSFHGTAFSIVFKKDFWVVMDNAVKTRNTRIECLLDEVGLSDRIVFCGNNQSQNVLKKIDYSGFDNKLCKLVNASKDFLINSILKQ